MIRFYLIGVLCFSILAVPTIETRKDVAEAMTRAVFWPVVVAVVIKSAKDRKS